MRFLTVLCFLTFACSSTHRYPLAICAIFKNEAPWLKEWLTYHHNVLGVKHFYLYNNDSTDHYAEILRPFINRGIVELIDWGSDDPSHTAVGAFMDAPWSAAQLGAYNDCLKNRALGNARWVAMIDIDEFIVPAKGIKAFYDFLRSSARKGKGTITLFWRVFGSSDVESLEEGELLIEKLIWRSRDDHPWNKMVKSIHQPEGVASCLVHVADKLNENYRSKTMLPEEASIHHYWTRTSKACLEKRNKSKSSHPEFFEEFHQIKDEAILKYIPLLKRGG